MTQLKIKENNMKKILIILLACLLLTSCSWTDEFTDKYLYTTMYPIEYAANALYGDYVKVSSVYPNSSDKSYMLKQNLCVGKRSEEETKQRTESTWSWQDSKGQEEG